MFNSTYYSILQANSKPSAVIKRLKELDYKVGIICDNELFGTLEFYYACKKEDLKPIISQKLEIEGVNFILIAKNEEGYRNLSRMSKYKEKTLEILNTHKENLFIVFDFDNTNKENVLYATEFLTSKNIKTYGGLKIVKTIEDKVKDSLIRSLNLENIPVEVSKYINEKDYRNNIASNAIKEKGLYDNFSILPNSQDEYIKEKSYWMNTYPNEIKSLMNIIKECTDDYSFGNPVPPKYKFCSETAVDFGLPADTTEEELFAYVSKEGLKEKLKNIDSSKHQEYIERLEYEIDIINQMKFPGYMLIVWDFVIAAKEMKIPVGPGRGSAAGSLVAYALKITNIDPMPYGLLFERFLNPERISMPDIDMDFCKRRRGEIIQFVIDKYGEKNVAQIITFGQMGGKSVIRDSGRILSYPLPLTDKLAKKIPETVGIKLDEAYEIEKDEIDAILSKSTHAQRVWKFANELEGVKRNLGVHAAGLVISDNDVTEKCPKYHVGDTQVVQYEGKYLEDVDLIKFDFLGLKTLSVIDYCLKIVKETKNIDIDLDHIKFEKEVFDYISTGQTKGLFQIESEGMQDLCSRLQPDCFEDLVAILALYRPGPMESGMLDDFIDRKQGRQKISYFFDDMTEALEPILKPTYGVIVYQEQVMQIVQTIGGFSLGGADLVRRAMGKKKKEEMDKIKVDFTNGAVEKGYKKEESEELFDLIVKFAGYGFNKSHSAAYALVTYYTATLKYHHPVEFMASLMNFDFDKHDKLIPFIQEARRMNIKVNNPDINSSTGIFTVKDNEIVYGLKGIKGIGADIDSVFEKRDKEGEFLSLVDFMNRTRKKSPKLNKRIFTGLINSGTLDSLASRKYLVENLDNLMSLSKVKDFEDLEEHVKNDSKEELDILEKVKLEKDSLGHILSNPFENIQSQLNEYDIATLDTMVAGPNKFVGWVESKKNEMSKKGNKYAKISIIDLNKNTIQGVIFKTALMKIDSDKSLDLNKPIICELNCKDDSFIVNSISVLDRKAMNNSFAKKDIVEETDVSIELGDFKSLLENQNVKRVKIHEDGRTIFSIIN